MNDLMTLDELVTASNAAISDMDVADGRVAVNGAVVGLGARVRLHRRQRGPH